MNNNIQILYNNINLFSGISPTPFVSMDQEFINFNTGWNQITKMSMNGQITGRYLGNLSYYELNSGLNLLISRLSNNYGTLVIREQSENLFSGTNVIIDSITTEESPWYGILPFTVNFEIYETELFTNYFGVIDPEETIDFNEEDGFIVNVTHSISARGLKTGSNNAITSAKNWVLSRTGTFNKVVPIMVRTGNGSDFLLQSVKETVDRFNGSYNWEGSYTKSTFVESPSSAILNYKLDLSSGLNDGLVTVQVDGSLSNNIITGSNINNLRSGYFSLNLYNIANQASLDTFNTILNNNPISQSVTEEENNQRLNFTATYNNDLISNIVNDYTIDINTDSVKNITDVSISARIFGKYGDVNARWPLVKDFYEKNFNAYNLANTEYKKEVGGRTLYSTPRTESITFNEYTSEINYNASWSDKRVPFSDNIINMTSSVNYTPSVNINVSNTSATTPREHNIQNLKCANRAVLEISVSATAKPNKNISFAITEVTNEISRIQLLYNMTNLLLQDRNVTNDSVSKTYSVTETYSFDGGIIS